LTSGFHDDVPERREGQTLEEQSSYNPFIANNQRTFSEFQHENMKYRN
jgi:hypothetical protein